LYIQKAFPLAGRGDCLQCDADEAACWRLDQQRFVVKLGGTKSKAVHAWVNISLNALSDVEISFKKV
jgi:hypothetical protein